MKALKNILLILLGIVILVILAGMYKFNYLSNQANYDVDGNKINGNIAEKSEIPPTHSDVDTATTTIRIANTEPGAEVSFETYTVPETTGVLHASLSKLFEVRSDEQGLFYGLAYDGVILDNGVARVFLKGQYYPAGTLSGFYLRYHLTDTALQFDTVHTVEVYVNDELFDWCIDDMSDGEGGCPEQPRYWIDTK